MKANQKFVNGDEAVSPVIAVILMVAITVVLAATVYLFVSGFGSNQSQIVTASFAAKSVDVPGGDTDTSDDSIELTYTSGDGDLSTTDVEMFINGRSLTWLTGANPIFVESGALAQNDLCSNDPANDNDAVWERGASVHVTLNEAAAPAVGDCGANPAAFANQGNMDTVGVWSVKVVVRGQVVLDTSIEVHDDGGA